MRERQVRQACSAGVLVLLVALVVPGFAGCGYSIRPPFDRNVRTVYVPMFRSVVFRRDVNMMLTETVIHEIQRRTPYKVVGKPEHADTTLEGSVTFADKNLIVENPFNLPRQLTTNLTASVTWTDNRTEKMVGTPFIVNATVNFFPEVGETSEAAFQRACDRLAEEIVGAMEKPW
jgi:Lipopolysaccharide-assembly